MIRLKNGSETTAPKLCLQNCIETRSSYFPRGLGQFTLDLGIRARAWTIEGPEPAALGPSSCSTYAFVAS